MTGNSEGQQLLSDSNESSISAVAFVRRHRIKILAISAAVSIPCFWHKHMEAGDLASHVYNAWLTTLIERGQAPGLYLVHQWSNVLFDMLLTHLGALLGFGAAEKILACGSILIFFWGAFALIFAVSRQAPWFLTPAIAALAYGWTFECGFNNFYLSVAFAFWSMALLWNARGWRLAAGIVLMPLAWLAHPLGCFLALGGFLYVLASKHLPGWWKATPFLASLFIVVATRSYLAHHLIVQWPRFHWTVNGIDQMILAVRYRPLAEAVFFSGLLFLSIDAWLRREDPAFWARISLPAGLYVVTMAGVLLLPDSIVIPQYDRPFGPFAWRVSLIAGIFAVGVLGCLKPRIVYVLAFGVAALIFFVFLWQDTGKIADLESQAEKLLAPLPQGSRVMVTLYPTDASRLYFMNHIVDRACIGHCFSYGNYEPSTKQFRVRVLPGSPVVASASITSNEMQTGTYVVQAKDLPVFQIMRCTATDDKLCLRELHAGEVNGSAFP